MKTIIESAQNRFFKKYKSLIQKKYRESEGLFLLEGQRYVDTAIEKGHLMEAVLLDEHTWHENQSSSHYEDHCDVIVFSDSLFKELIQTENTQGIVGVLKMPSEGELEMHLDTHPSDQILFLDRIQDPGNLGTIIRTADAAGMETIILSKGSADAYNPKVVRSTAGSILNVHLFYVDDALKTLEALKRMNYKCVATSLEGAVDYNLDDNYGDKNCLIIGNEANGVSMEVLEVSDVKVKIPIYGGAESLNASVAAGIMMYRIKSSR